MCGEGSRKTSKICSSSLVLLSEWKALLSSNQFHTGVLVTGKKIYRWKYMQFHDHFKEVCVVQTFCVC